ncbi:hypothetical protein BGX29_005240, partial [Mortierella sp. GBA35]
CSSGTRTSTAAMQDSSDTSLSPSPPSSRPAWRTPSQHRCLPTLLPPSLSRNKDLSPWPWCQHSILEKPSPMPVLSWSFATQDYRHCHAPTILRSSRGCSLCSQTSRTLPTLPLPLPPSQGLSRTSRSCRTTVVSQGSHKVSATSRLPT